MTVTFAEVGGENLHEIGTAQGARGTLEFAPADGPAGKRKIVALIDQDGLPRPRVALASFTAPGPSGRAGTASRGRNVRRTCRSRSAPPPDATATDRDHRATESGA